MDGNGKKTTSSVDPKGKVEMVTISAESVVVSPGTKARVEDVRDHEIAFEQVFQKLDFPKTFAEILESANAANLDEVISVTNQGNSSVASSSFLGKLVDPGKIGIIDYNGSVQLVGPGRWIIMNPRANIMDIKPLTDNLIQYESLTIARVVRGEVGLATENGQPLVLGEGIHVKNNRLFKFIKHESVNQQYLKHGSIHIIRVPKGNYGLVTEQNVPKLLPEGTHVTNANVFTYDGLQLINQPYIKHGTLHILRVPRGQVALVFDNNLPKLLEGTHCINSKTFNFVKMEEINQQAIRHGTITQFRVRKGEVGCCWENNQPVFFEEGVFLKDSPLFQFESCVNAAQKQISLGAKKILTVWDGEVGVSYNKGKLIVLRPDRHFIDSADHIFQGFMSTQQQCLHLIDPKYTKEGLLTCETKDFVEIGLKADVFFKIADAEKVLLVVGADNVNNLVRETAVATLNSIMRSTSLAEVAQNKEVAAKSEKALLEQQQQNLSRGGKPPLFFDKVHDEFISKLHDTFMDHYGISITNIRIESFKIMNQELATSISKQAFTTAQTETQLSNLTGQTEIATAQMKRDAEVARIKAEGDAIKMRTDIDAKNKATMESAKAEADATVIRARAEAQAVEVRAAAEAAAIVMKAEAESKRASLLNSTVLGGQIQMYQMYANMVRDSVAGVNKVIYLPTDSVNNPLSFMNLTQGTIPGFTPSTNTKRT